MTKEKMASKIQFDIFEDTSKSVFAADSYEDFRNRLTTSGCAKCPELCETRHNIVPDRGNPNTKIVVIGEGPGENEDLQGKAFVGRAGQLLDKIMDSIGLDTNKDMLIINVVKCRPPKNRAPKPQEAENCKPYLKWQLDHVKPKVILLLGATAAKHLVPKEKMTAMKDMVGRFIDLDHYPDIKFMVLFHPAYLLRDPRKKTDMWEHVKGLKQYLDAQDWFKQGVGSH